MRLKRLLPLLFTDQKSSLINLQRAISDERYREAEQLLGRDGMIDLIGVLGYYSLVSMTLKAFDIKLLKPA